jgi:DNA repair photolyase
MKLPLFNSSEAVFCTCLPKYNLNTYLGRCGHQCVYCYAVKFPSFTGPAKPRIKLLDQIENMAIGTKLKLPVMISNCTDPYQPLESKSEITRKCAQTLAKHEFPLLIVTKSDLVLRDIDVFKRTPTVVAISITTPRPDIADLIEPYAPAPEKRILALEKLIENNVCAVARIDPILPGINDDLEDFKSLVSSLANIGVRQVSISTMKLVRGAFSTIRKVHPTVWKEVVSEYSNGQWLAGYKYLHVNKRMQILEKLRPIVLDYGLRFAACREGFSQLNTAICDGTDCCRRLLQT